MIKIAFVIDTIESPTAGTEKQLLMLIKHLDRSKFQPYLCVLRPSVWLRESFKDCELVNIGFPSFGKLQSYFNLFSFVNFLKKHQVDIVQTHFVEGNKVGVFAGRLAGVKAIVSTRRNQGYWHSKLEILMLSVLNKWVTRFLANSLDTCEWAARTERIDPEKIVVIHNGLEIGHYHKVSDDLRKAFRQELGFPEDAIVIGIVANLRPVKALDVFLMAARVVSETCVQARFILVGEGPERQMLEKLSMDLGIAPLVRFLGQRQDIPAVLGRIDIGVLSSLSESFSNAIVEYMAAGLPVVCTDVGGAREAIENGMNGYVVASASHTALAEGLRAILDCGDLQAMGQMSRKKAVGMFSHETIFLQYEQFYEGVATR